MTRAKGHRIVVRSRALAHSGKLVVMKSASARRDPHVVSRCMRAVRSTGTHVESSVGCELQRRGHSFDLNASDLPGKPDVVFRREKLAVFIDGDYWHGRQWKLRRFSSLEKQFYRISNKDYWIAKISSNMRRDRKINRQLRGSGWHVVRIWESDWKKNPNRCIERIERFL